MSEPDSFGAQPPSNLSRPIGALICDDEPLLRELLGSTFFEQGFRIFLAENGVEGWSLFRKQPQEIDLLVTDLVMPELGGGQLILQAQSLKPSIKSILMTGFVEPELPSDLNRSQVHLMHKPFSTLELVRLAKALFV